MNCDNCGKEVSRRMKETQKHVFCSRLCFLKFKNTHRKTFICSICGKPYQHAPGSRPRRRCKECFGVNKNGRPKQPLIHVLCAVCGKEGMISSSRLSKYNWYCSPRCSELRRIVKYARSVRMVMADVA